MFLLDGDFQPSPDFQQKFSNFARYFEHNPKTVFVVPAFEYIELPQVQNLLFNFNILYA